MIINQDPTGEMPEPGPNGNILLISQKPIFGLLTLNGFALGDIAMWCVYRFDPSTHTQYPGLLVMAVMWSIFLLMVPASIIYLIRGPASLSIDDVGIAWIRNGQRGKQIQWSDIREIELSSTVTTGRGQPIRGNNQFATTQIKLIGPTIKSFRLPNFGIAPTALARYVLQQQNKRMAGERAILTDNTVPDSQPMQLRPDGKAIKHGTKKISRIILYSVIILLAAAKLALIFFRNSH